MKLDSVIFYSNDIDTAVSFYSDILECMIDYQQENYVSLWLDEGIRLGIKQSNADRERPGSQTMIISSKDIDEVYNQLLDRGVSFYKTLRHLEWGSTFSILDPDGNKIEFLHRVTHT